MNQKNYSLKLKNKKKFNNKMPQKQKIEKQEKEKSDLELSIEKLKLEKNILQKQINICKEIHNKKNEIIKLLNEFDFEVQFRTHNSKYIRNEETIP